MALDAILAFMPNVPNWAYNGAALGIGDFSNNARDTAYGGWERVLQHYRAGVDQHGLRDVPVQIYFACKCPTIMCEVHRRWQHVLLDHSRTELSRLSIFFLFGVYF
jgi:hypothetical protein